MVAFLSHLATHGRVSASTQNQALAAILFLYRSVLERDLPWLDEIVRAKRPHRMPVVLTRREVQDLLARMDGAPRVVATLLYGYGLRLLEALGRKYPGVGRSVPWQWVFPATGTYRDRETGQVRRHHLHETVVQKAVHLGVCVTDSPSHGTCVGASAVGVPGAAFGQPAELAGRRMGCAVTALRASEPFVTHLARLQASLVFIRRRFSAKQTKFHSPRTFRRPRIRKARKPSTCFTHPKTGSTIAFRLL